MRPMRRDASAFMPPKPFLLILAVVAVVAILAVVLLLPVGKGNVNLYKCADGTVVTSADKCPAPNPLKLGVYSTVIIAHFADGTQKVLTEQTPFDQLTVSYVGKDVTSFDFMSSFAAGDASVRIKVRPEIDLMTTAGILVRGSTGDLVEKTIPKGLSQNLFSMSIDSSFFSGVFGGTYNLRFVSHLLSFDVLKADGTVETTKSATLYYAISVSVPAGGGGGGGCDIRCRPQPTGILSDPVLIGG